MKKFISFFITHKHSLLVSTGFLLVSVIIFAWPSPASADTLSQNVIDLFSNIFSSLVWAIGKILIILINLVIWVAQYNDFIGSKAVSTGWEILRDVCNMFFILILLVIAFATTLNIENYGMKKLLKDFIIAAVLINFSKVICGVIIDFAQVIMLTFVNGFRDIGGGNLADMLGLSSILSINADKCGENISHIAVLGTYILAFLYVVVASAVILAILFTLVMRIVMIWIYVVTSPLAYLLSVLPATKTYAGQWWKQFGEAVASGPILAFFIWLSFASIAVGTKGGDILKVEQGSGSKNEKEYLTQYVAKDDEDPVGCAGLSEAGSSEGMIKFIISIGLLIGGLMITKQAGGMVGGIAGGALGKLKGLAKGAGKLATRPVGDRWKAFQGQRDSARKEKIQAFGEKAYGKYITAQSAIKGAPKAGFETVKSWIPEDKRPGFGEALRNIKDTITFKEFRQSRRDRNEADNRRREAFQDPDNIYKDATGQEFNEIDEQGFYYRAADKVDADGNFAPKKDDEGNIIYKTDKDGNKIEKKDKDGNVIAGEYEFVREKDEEKREHAKEEIGGKEQKVKQMSEREYNVSNSWATSMKDAWAYTNKKEEQDIAKEQQKMSDAGLTSAQLLQMLQSSGTSDRQKLATAMTLAIKEGFKNNEQIKDAEKVLGTSNNALLSKKFNDDVDKKQAYLHYDMEAEVGRKKFEKRLTDGKVETQQDKAYEKKEVIQAYDNVYTDKEFVKKMDQISGTSSKHDTAQATGIRNYIDTLKSPTVDPVTGKLNKVRSVAPKITKNLNDAVRGSGLTEKDISEAINAYSDNASASDIAKLDIASFTADKTVFKTQSEQQNYENVIKKMIGEWSEQHINNIERSRDSNRAVIEKIREIKGVEDSKGVKGSKNVKYSKDAEDSNAAKPL